MRHDIVTGLRGKPAPTNPGRAGQAESRVNPKSTKREWLTDWMVGLERAEHTGEVWVKMHYNMGAITRLVPLLEVSPHHLGG